MILGSGSAVPLYGRHQTSQLVKYNSSKFLIDCGEGVQSRLFEHKIQYQKINHIFISHLHGDHYLGLVGLISSFHLFGRTKDLYIYGPKGIKDIVLVQLRASGTYLNYYVHFVELTEKKQVVLLDESLIEVSTIPLNHRIYCNGFLIREKEGERKLTKELIEIISGAEAL